MNKEYICIDGKAIITDENGNMTPIEYYDNLDEVLVQENLVETMEKKISQLENERAKHKKDPKHYIPMTPGFLLLGPILIFLLGIFAGLNEAPAFNTIYGISLKPIEFLSIGLPIFFSPVTLLVDIGHYRIYRRDKKRNKGISSELDFLKNQLEKEKEYLEDLNEKEKTRDNENPEFRVVEVDDKKQLNALDSYEDLYFGLGYNSDKYQKFYQRGELEERLEETHSEEAIQLAKQYFESMGESENEVLQHKQCGRQKSLGIR